MNCVCEGLRQGGGGVSVLLKEPLIHQKEAIVYCINLRIDVGEVVLVGDVCLFVVVVWQICPLNILNKCKNKNKQTNKQKVTLHSPSLQLSEQHLY